jgi:hypothetical protein
MMQLETGLLLPLFSGHIVITVAVRSNYKSRDSSVGIAMGYGVDGLGSRVRFLAGAGNFSLHHHVQNGSGAHLSNGFQGLFPWRQSGRGVKLTTHLVVLK